jgi:hypothetical protein
VDGRLGSKTHNKPTSLVVIVLLQRHLMQTLDVVDVGAPDTTNLIIHHGVADILNHAAKPVHVLGAIQEPRDFASLCQWDEVLEDAVQFPNKSYTSD